MHRCVFIIFSFLLLCIQNTTTNQLVAAEGGGGDDNGVITNKCLDKERDALLQFKANLEDPYGSLSTWRPEDDECCEWRGVMCGDETGHHVTWLEIRSFGLVGEISPSLVNLTYLNHLDLFGNFFNGTIPKSFGSLTELMFLDLSNNSFYGTIPEEFGNLTNLQNLYLDFFGRCRVENLQWLSHLSLLETLEMDGISLAKANHWVNVISSLPKLSRLSLEGCDLSKVIFFFISQLFFIYSIPLSWKQQSHLIRVSLVIPINQQ
ncbi:unnamed protein product [Lactuca virosa]|uniref:Leucine-rich repeat-containing N-terminal plant-type domain-containing protein n=1 Tax=Lactuca virosa TaxID=75947 RepID=A0AAU9PST1_9ASTR|nr:unnamed protein product [Lactuca virosa]